MNVELVFQHCVIQSKLSYLLQSETIVAAEIAFDTAESFAESAEHQAALTQAALTVSERCFLDSCC